MESKNNASENESIINELPIRFISKVVRGYGRGSSELGIPTANLSRDETISSIPKYDDLPCGIYWGFARVINNTKDDIIYKTAVSIGFNPYYKNETKTVEPHLIAPSNTLHRTKSSCQETVLDDFYEKSIRLSLVGYLRPELPFDGLENLIQAIKNDIQMTEKYADDMKNPLVLEERSWVGSNEDCVHEK